MSRACIPPAAGKHRHPVRSSLIALCGAGAIGGALAIAPSAAAGATPAPLQPSAGFQSMLYDTTANASIIVTGDLPAGRSVGPGVTPQRGALRQEPSDTNLVGSADRIGRINANGLIGRTAAQMVSIIRDAINSPCTEVINGVSHNFGCASHLIAIDEIGLSFSDPRSKSAPSSTGVGLTGKHLSQAMETLSKTRSPWGTSYAARVEVYVTAGMTLAISAGRGPEHELGATGRKDFPTWNGVMPGLARAGALWLEMYRGVGAKSATGPEPMTARQWEQVPTRFATFFKTFGGHIPQLHFLFNYAGDPGSSCSTQACQWANAAIRGDNRSILTHGPGEYRLGSQAAAWLEDFDAYFPARN